MVAVTLQDRHFLSFVFLDADEMDRGERRTKVSVGELVREKGTKRKTGYDFCYLM